MLMMPVVGVVAPAGLGVEAAGATPRHADCQVESDTTTVYELAWT